MIKSIVKKYLIKLGNFYIKNGILLQEKQKLLVVDDTINELFVKKFATKSDYYDFFDKMKNEIRINSIKNKWFIVDQFEKIYKRKVKKCPLCECDITIKNNDAITSRCIFGGGMLNRFQCPECKVIFGPMKMLDLTDDELKEEYNIHYSIFSEGDSTESELKAFELLKPSFGKKYLNYGSGAWSKSIEILLSQGYDIYGYEPSSVINSLNKRIFNDRRKLQSIKFDGIYSNNVLEHLRYPNEEMRYLSNLLNPNGVMVHATPCFEYLYEYTRFHLFFFLENSREYIIRGLDLVEEGFVKDGEFMAVIYRKGELI